MKKRRPSVHRVQNKGLPNYELMTDVFYDSGAQGTIPRSSNVDPLTDEQEKDMLKRHEGTSKPTVVHLDEDDDTSCEYMDFFKPNENGEGDINFTACKRQKTSVQMAETCPKPSKSHQNMDSIPTEEAAWKALELESLSRARKYEAQMQLIHSRTSGNSEDKYSIAACLRVLREEFPNIPATSYLKASRLFQDPRYCMRWIELNCELRRMLVESDFSL